MNAHTDTETVTVAADAIPADMMGLDIGPASAQLYAEKLADTRTVFWNGPMGAFEMAPFAEGTRRLAQALVDVTAQGALTVVGGGVGRRHVLPLRAERHAPQPGQRGRF